VPPCVSRFRRHSPRGGCRGCFRNRASDGRALQRWRTGARPAHRP
jgi:hypothetical protein